MPNVIIWIYIVLQCVLLIALLGIIWRVLPIIFLYNRPLPFVPTQQKVVNLIIESGVLKNKKNIVDLGCGDGVLISGLRKKYKDAEFFGVEISSNLARIARLRFLLAKSKPKIEQGDMFMYPISDADAIVGFWIPKLMPKISEKFIKECKPGCIIVSNMFELPQDAEKYFSKERIDHKKEKIFIYQKM
ncbi:MAG: class I SAM-dependent methyltransferase [bacterium]|nr:class I SAM-dependent methyltransferase [bacterium]